MSEFVTPQREIHKLFNFSFKSIKILTIMPRLLNTHEEYWVSDFLLWSQPQEEKFAICYNVAFEHLDECNNYLDPII